MNSTVPYRLTRLHTIMVPEPGNAFEVEGVLNPASGRTPDGDLYLLPRLVAEGNVSRVGIAKVVLEDGVPIGVEREGVVLAPDAGWEHGLHHAGTEDPRVTWVPTLGLHVMTYVAFGPLGPRTALAVSTDLRTWRRLGPIHFEYQEELDVDLNLCSNKDVVVFPEIIEGPDGIPCYAMIHRPTWDIGWIRPGEGFHVPAGLTDDRPGMWISYAPAAPVQQDVAALVHQHDSRQLALPESPFEALKIGAGPAPIRVPEGWLLIHHGVSGVIIDPWSAGNDAHYAAGAMILDGDDPSRVIARTPEPLLAPETADEIVGTVGNVVFPTAIEKIGVQRFVFYGMADAKIGVARLDRVIG